MSQFLRVFLPTLLCTCLLFCGFVCVWGGGGGGGGGGALHWFIFVIVAFTGYLHPALYFYCVNSINHL